MVKEVLQAEGKLYQMKIRIDHFEGASWQAAALCYFATRIVVLLSLSFSLLLLLELLEISCKSPNF